jgi:hypothetical protein
MATYKMSTYTIDRKSASRLLKVTMRTVDRYIKSKHISSKVINGRVWLNKDQIINFRDRQRVKGVLSIDNYVDNVDSRVDKHAYTSDKVVDESGHTINENRVDSDIDNIDNDNNFTGTVKSRGKIMDESANNVYKDLYEKLLEEFDEKQVQLEMAKYRVGKLESQLKYSVPLIEYRKKTTLLLTSGENLKKQLENEKKDKLRVYTQFRTERLNKRIYLILAIALILLQPLWLLFLYF